MDTRREQIIDIIQREFIGPDPINEPGFIQSNGEEILVSDPPRVRYIAGVLFPQAAPIESSTAEEDDVDSGVNDDLSAEDTIQDILIVKIAVQFSPLHYEISIPCRPAEQYMMKTAFFRWAFLYPAKDSLHCLKANAYVSTMMIINPISFCIETSEVMP